MPTYKLDIKIFNIYFYLFKLINLSHIAVPLSPTHSSSQTTLSAGIMQNKSQNVKQPPLAQSNCGCASPLIYQIGQRTCPCLYTLSPLPLSACLSLHTALFRSHLSQRQADAKRTLRIFILTLIKDAYCPLRVFYQIFFVVQGLFACSCCC